MMKIVAFLSTYIKSNEKTNKKIYLNVPYVEKDAAKAKGARFDYNKKMWYFTNPNDSYKFTKWMKKNIFTIDELSDEQQALVNLVKEGKNVFVDACIGSGKTTTIQVLCDELPHKIILYLTYNRLLKVDAKSKIQSKNTVVTNYHGFASYALLQNKIDVISGVNDLIQAYITNFERMNNHPRYELLLLDEYQDIDEEISDMLTLIKVSNPGIQIVAVGDMNQKIYDKTKIDAVKFIKDFLGDHESLSFTKCFRLNADYANRLGRIWNKKIIGMNNECEVKMMSYDQIKSFLENQSPSDILCIGSRLFSMQNLLNVLESEHPEKFNKNTVYASISSEDRRIQILTNNSVALFTTFDSCKGLERKICVIFDFTIEYWKMRSNVNNTRYEILRNIFCVAASRGKSMIIFAEMQNYHMLTDEVLMTRFVHDFNYNMPFFMYDMFEFKYKEKVEECFDLLKIEKDESAVVKEIDVNDKCGLIDLSICIQILQMASFFNEYNIDEDINLTIFCRNLKLNPDFIRNASIEEKVLYECSLLSRQERYFKQVEIPFVDDETLNEIHHRIGEIFTKDDTIQIPCEIKFKNNGHDQKCLGFCDAIKNDAAWKIMFTSGLRHEDFLQCACYMIALSMEKGVIWNIKTNKRFFITIPDRKKFMEAVINTITKGISSNIVWNNDP